MANYRGHEDIKTVNLPGTNISIASATIARRTRIGKDLNSLSDVGCVGLLVKFRLREDNLGIN